MRKLLRNIMMWTEGEIRKVFLAILDENGSAKILDCGCSDGSFTMKMAAKIGTKDIHGIELVANGVKLAETRGIKVHSTDLNQKLPLDDETFDVVLANQVIEHLHRTDTFIKEIWRILKHGGYAVLATPNLASFHNLIFLLLGFQPPTACVSNEMKVSLNLSLREDSRPTGADYPANSHLRIFTGAGIRKLLQYHGFEVEQIKGIGWYPFAGKFARFMTRIDGRHGAYLVVKVRKVSHTLKTKPSLVA